jgi:allophanate hydrolase
LPFGVTFIGPCGSDWQLAELGQRFHHATALTQGATGLPLPEPEPIAGLTTQAWVRVAVVGAHLSGMPLHHQLTERHARFVGEAHTAPDYLLFALGNTQPPKPGMLRVAKGQGVPVALEIWEMSAAHFGTFVALIPSPLCIGTLQLDDGQSVHGFLCEAQATLGAKDISRFKGWRAYIDHLQS